MCEPKSFAADCPVELRKEGKEGKEEIKQTDQVAWVARMTLSPYQPNTDEPVPLQQIRKLSKRFQVGFRHEKRSSKPGKGDVIWVYFDPVSRDHHFCYCLVALLNSLRGNGFLDVKSLKEQ